MNTGLYIARRAYAAYLEICVLAVESMLTQNRRDWQINLNLNIASTVVLCV